MAIMRIGEMQGKRILIACEYSGIVSQAFEAKGFNVVSCDLLPRTNGGTHYKGDLFDVLYDGWDAVIAFPPCTYLAKAQLHMKDYDRLIQRKKALNFVQMIWEADIPFKCIENPIGHLNTHWRPPSQILSPHFFGSPYSKETCFWLQNLPPLIYTCMSPGTKKVANHVNSRMSQSQKSHIKSKFFPELARAMVDQWTSIIREGVPGNMHL